MEFLEEGKQLTKLSFFQHVFDGSDDGKGEVYNVAQFALTGFLPVVILNKLILKFIPEAEPSKSSLELLVEIFVQLLIIFCGIIIICRMITFFPTFSGKNYDIMNLTSTVLPFMVIILSIQSKLSVKTNILYDRVIDLWNGTESKNMKYTSKYKESMVPQQQSTQPQPTTIPDNNDEQLHFSSPPRAEMDKKEEPAWNPVAANGMIGNFGSF